MFCNKGYSEAYQLKQHIKFVHNKERPYQCQHCEKAFSTAIQLGQHMQYHTGNFRYQCPVCEKCFITGQALTKHGRNSKSCREKNPDLTKTRTCKRLLQPPPPPDMLVPPEQLRLPGMKPKSSEADDTKPSKTHSTVLATTVHLEPGPSNRLLQHHILNPPADEAHRLNQLDSPTADVRQQIASPDHHQLISDENRQHPEQHHQQTTHMILQRDQNIMPLQFQQNSHHQQHPVQQLQLQQHHQPHQPSQTVEFSQTPQAIIYAPDPMKPTALQIRFPYMKNRNI